MQNALRVTSFPQVYGGGVSVVVQPYIWSLSSGYADVSTSAGDTIASGILIIFIDCNFSGSISSTRTKSGLILASLDFIAMHFCLTPVDSPSNSRSQARTETPDWPLQALMYVVFIDN